MKDIKLQVYINTGVFPSFCSHPLTTYFLQFVFYLTNSLSLFLSLDLDHCAVVVNISDGGVVFKLPPFGFRSPHMVRSAFLSHTARLVKKTATSHKNHFYQLTKTGAAGRGAGAKSLGPTGVFWLEARSGILHIWQML